MDRKTILVTGAAGYIGSVATYILLKCGYRVLALDNFSTGFREPLSILKKEYPEMLSIYEMDIASPNIDSMFGTSKIDGIMHFASPCNVDESVKNPAKYYHNIVEGTNNLLFSAINHRVKNFIFSSTCAVYGEPVRLPIGENHPTNPINPYGKAKLEAENLVKQSGLKYVIFRYFNVCGTSDDTRFGDSKNPSSALVQNAVRGALGIERFRLTYQKSNTKDGSPVRDYIDVSDLVDAHIAGLIYLERVGISDIFNLGTGKGVSVLEIVNMVEKITGKEIVRNMSTAPRLGEVAQIFASYRKANDLLKWNPGTNLAASTDNLVRWYKKKPSGWEY